MKWTRSNQKFSLNQILRLKYGRIKKLTYLQSLSVKDLFVDKLLKINGNSEWTLLIHEAYLNEPVDWTVIKISTMYKF